jgi:hypothetical protein
MRRWKTRLASAVLGFGALAMAAGPALAQGIVYPGKGQSPQQQQKDQADCNAWAVQQTGFNPANPQVAGPPPPSSGAPQGGVARGGARGAAIGAVGGAIGGDAGKGAAIGAATGALIGGMRRRDQRRQEENSQQQYAQQQQAAMAQGQSAYNRALGACLEARGYTVR